MPGTSYRALVALGLAVVMVAPVAAGSTDATEATVTYTKDVAPILFDNCVSCHRAGQIGPMSLMTYDEVRPWAKSIRRVTSEGTMPPWLAAPDHGSFKNDPTLTDQEVATLTRWAATGAKKGDEGDFPEAPTFSSEWQIGTPDAIFTMEPFEVSDDVEDHYQWLTIENHLDEDRWVKAIEIRPTFMAGAHHNLTFIAPPGASGRESLREERNLFAGWAPGATPVYFEEDHGKLLPAGATLLFQMHYHKDPGPGTGGVDQTSVAVLFHDEPVQSPVTTVWILDPALDIPPGATDYESVSVFEFSDDGTIFGMTPHMHLRGSDIQYVAEYPDGTSEVLLDVPVWDFNWQIGYALEEPKSVPKGTKVRVTAHFDNSADNPFNPDPTIAVKWGEKTTDEMMIGFMDYTYETAKDQQETTAVPEHMREMFERMRKARAARNAQAAEEGAGSGR